ncbi:MAG: hypothetical protein CL675_04895 [Bdellovibrionaceae bacterium]|mgnify:CR=1 FL=1|nr:hypothetical protein [Pseudobdellovibrionaceae bacterium]|tara:strand:- start:210 stop:392 length:183 start_codon:yes stop_codon:yes gene_type:complete
MNDEKARQLEALIKKLDEASSKMQASKGFNKATENMKILESIIKEQLNHEDSGPATRTVR